MKTTKRFEIDHSIIDKILLTGPPDAYLNKALSTITCSIIFYGHPEEQKCTI